VTVQNFARDVKFLLSKDCVSFIKRCFSCCTDVRVLNNHNFNLLLNPWPQTRSLALDNEKRHQEQRGEGVTVAENNGSSKKEIVFEEKGQGKSSKVTDCTAKSEDPKPTSPPDLTGEDVRCPVCQHKILAKSEEER
jgi:DNA-directed RNA polymerase subunit RPC12/RpoP